METANCSSRDLVALHTEGGRLTSVHSNRKYTSIGSVSIAAHSSTPGRSGGTNQQSTGSGGQFPTVRRSAQTGTKFRRTDAEYDIYAAYCEDDEPYVLPLLDVFRQKRLVVYDPNTDALPNETYIKAWLENGINKSKASVIFLTKHFVSNAMCRYQAEHAVMRYAVTKGRHRLHLIMLESCKIPKYLRHFQCVYAWKFSEDPAKQRKRILGAIRARVSKFRRGSLIWTNSSSHSKCGDLPRHPEKIIDNKQLVFYKDLLLNVKKIKFTLENCELRCLSTNCGYRVAGHRVLEFYGHLKVCNYQKAMCRYCKQTTFRKNLQKHESSTCRNRQELCPNESCGRRLTVREMDGHLRLCPCKEEQCPNNGCIGVFARKDREKHFEICDYVVVQCKRCNEPVFRLDLDHHTCQKQRLSQLTEKPGIFRPDELYICGNQCCDFKATRTKIEEHEHTCEHRITQCSDCGMRLPCRDLIWHQRECDKMFECALCLQVIPSSSRLTHDRWICSRRNILAECEKCHAILSTDRYDLHQTSCIVPTLAFSDSSDNHHHRSVCKTRVSTETDSVNAISSQIPIRHHGSPDRFSQLIAGTQEELQEELRHGHATFEQVASRSISGGVSVDCKWTPNTRDKWRQLMTLLQFSQP